ncbi:Ger(x)C family spore germination protein [Neobacillus rhizophilus]|uniref:Ger(X)C family spore germination protein n=1 Tax=Neobacillus rhizophilus TaxID=2833579 RepID=A0A942UCQ1_9BACI|nr:Ger(x)C family spore germination protein [Neobacillus rhizophilus]MBS4216258.1 Ger(x)C family spore germination protein [Neobacillus rhizophilus]
MRNIIKRFIVLTTIPFLLSGCWDQRLLKEQKLILLIGYDKGHNGKIISNTDYPISKGVQNNSASTTKSTILTTEGETALDTLLHADLNISEKIDISKAQVVLFGEEMARQGLYKELDHIYRNPKGALGAKVAIIEGKARDAVRIKQEEANLNGQYYDEYLKSGEATGFFTNYNVQSVCPLLLKHTKDPLLPLLKISPERHRARSIGMALFNNEKMTGKLNVSESKMFLLLNGEKKQKVSFLLNTNNQDSQKEFIVIEILNNRQKTKLSVKNEAVTSILSSKLQYRITEYPKDQLTNPILLKKLNKTIQKRLTKKAEKTIAKLQAANCDGFGIEEEIRVHHHQLWKEKYKNADIKNIPIKAKLDLELINSGIIN